MKERRFKFLAVCAALMCAGCVSWMEKAGQVIDGSAFAEKRIAVYYGDGTEVALVENKAGEQSVIITLTGFPMMKLRGTSPNENGEFFLTSLEYLGGSVHGWNEYTLDLLGTGSLVLEESAYYSSALQITEEIEPVQISAGRIHRYDTRIVGNSALTSLRNRRERIVSTVEWMASIEGAPYGLTVKNFEKYWKPLLFPEMVSKRTRPEGWSLEGDMFVRAEDIRWNTSYTQRIFPEELRQVRDSGTLFRDWEEALSWIYLEYEWENIKEMLSHKIILQQKI
jgi:hypothetical protein